MRKDLQLPSIATLTRITSTCAKKCSSSLLNTVFSLVENSQKVCVMLVDEVDVKKSLQFHKGEVFGKAAANNSSLLVDTMLGQMVNCLHWGPDFILTMTPVSKLNADFKPCCVHLRLRHPKGSRI